MEIYMKETRIPFAGIQKVYSFEKKPDFEPVNYALEVLWSDVNPYEIIATNLKSKKLTIRSMNERQINEIPCQVGGFGGHSENSAQKWEITSDPNGATFEISLRKNGKFYRVGSSMKSTVYTLTEEPYKFYDYNF